MANYKVTDLEQMSDLDFASKNTASMFLYIVDGNEAEDNNKAKKVNRSDLVGWKFLTTPLTSTNWDGDAKSNAGPTKLDMSAVFTNYPDMAVKAVLLRVAARDSASIGTSGLYFSVGPSATYYYALQANPPGADVLASTTGICPCDANGDIYYKITASGSGTCDCWLEVWGYWI